MKKETLEWIEKERIIAVVRGAKPEQCIRTAEALYRGGIRLMELTFNQKDPSSFASTAASIKSVCEAYQGRMLIGAGTVMSAEQVDMAASAGARYIVSPNVDETVICRTNELGLVSLPGALTPSEIVTAHQLGADYVKLFPVGGFGPDYVKAIAAPISHIKMLAVGGVNENNAAAFLKAGAYGVGVGGNLANKKWIANGEFERITEVAEKLVASVHQYLEENEGV